MIFLNVDIKNKKENILLSRIEVECRITFEGKETPSNEQLGQKLAAVLEVDKNLLVIKSIYTEYGTTVADVTAYQYLSEEELLIQEPAVAKARVEKEKKAKEESAKKAEEKPAEEKKEEAPAEKKKEEQPVEEKKEEAPAKEEKKE